MLRKSPYVEENYNYITAMMDNMKLQQETLFNQPTPYFNNQMQDSLYNNNQNLFANNTNQFINNNNFAYNVRDIDTKKQIQTDCSVYDKTLNLLNKGAQMTMEMDTMGTAPGLMYNQHNPNFQQNQNYNMNMMEQAPQIVQCIGCLKEKSQGLMQLENQMDSSQFTQCNYCRKSSCGPCTRRCDCCGRPFCKICVNIRYEEYMDKVVCLYCS